jgi:very-short-patch-repair endonuclease
MWRLLYPFRTGGYHFRKQEQIGPYYADFACHHAHVVIEVDGDTHGTASGEEHDRRRDEFQSMEGYSVLRFTNDDLMNNPDGVYEVISKTLEGRPRNLRSRRPLPGPPHKGEGEEAASPPADTYAQPEVLL